MIPDPHLWCQSVESITETDVQHWLDDHRPFQSASVNEVQEENEEQTTIPIRSVFE